jgi:hypothetical protein
MACLALATAFIKKSHRLYSTTYKIDFAQNCAFCTRFSSIQVVMRVHHFGRQKAGGPLISSEESRWGTAIDLGQRSKKVETMLGPSATVAATMNNL